MSRLDPIIFFQQFASPILDAFAIFLANFADLIFIVTVALVYWCIDKRKGEILGYVAVTNMLFSTFLKDLFKAERPIGQPGILTLAEESAPGYSFPSTHTQIFANLTGVFALCFKKPPLVVIMGILTILMGLSRMYLGVHYLLDVLGGIFFGLLVAIVGVWLTTHIQSRHRLYFCTALIASVFLFFKPSPEYVMIYFGYLAFWAGVAFEQRFVQFEATGSRKKKAFRFILGIILLMVVYVGLKQLPFPANVRNAIRYIGVVFTAIGLYPWLFKKINL